jgi:hypothetical protein
MSSILKVSVLALSLAAALPAAAVAQSYTAPAGIPTETAPGTVSGRPLERGVGQAAPSAYDAMVTGSVGRIQAHKPARR